MDNNPDNQFVNPNKKPEDTSSPPDNPQNQPADQTPAEPPRPGQQFQQSPDQPSSSEAYSSLHPPKPKRKWLKTLIALLVIAVLVALGWLLYKEAIKEEQPSAPVVLDKTIDQMNVGILSADYGKLYPDMAPSSYSYLVNSQMFEGLVRYEEKSKIAPLLATDWTNPDSDTWVFNLKEGVTFHNGNTLDASDVKYSIDTLKKSGGDIGEIFASTITSVEAVNDNRVKITTDGPDPTLLNRLAFLYVIDSDAADDAEPSQAGTGPYMIKPGTKPTTTDISMVAFDGYHGEAPTTKAVSFGSEKTSDGLIEAFQNGEYNIVGEIPESNANEVTTATQFVTSEPEVAFLGLNSTSQGPLSKKKVREAVRYAVDPVALGESEGSKVTPLSQLIPESIPGHNPAIQPYERDAAKAKQLLKEAGHPNGVDIRFTLSSDQALAKELKSQLAEAGINIKIEHEPDFDKFIDTFASGKAEMYYVKYASDVLDGLEMYSVNLDENNYVNPEYQQALDKAAKTVDPAKRLDLLQQTATIIDEDAAIIPLSTQDNIWLMDKDYDITQDMPSSFLSVYFSKTQLK